MREAISRAKKAQIDALGGYDALELDARLHDEFLARLDMHHRSLEARQLRGQGWTLTALGERYGVHYTTICHWVDPGRYERVRENAKRRRRERRMAA